MKNLIRMALAAVVLLGSVGPALACENCANCPMHKASQKGATADNAPATAPGDKKPAEKPKCTCTKGGECLCAKAGKPCGCAKPAPKPS